MKKHSLIGFIIFTGLFASGVYSQRLENPIKIDKPVRLESPVRLETPIEVVRPDFSAVNGISAKRGRPGHARVHRKDSRVCPGLW